MLRLLWSDLRFHWPLWLWTGIVTAVCAANVLGQLMLSAGFVAGAEAGGTQSQVEEVQALTSFSVFTILLASVTVLTSTVSLAVGQKGPDYGLWKTLGIRPAVLVWIITGQLAVLGLIATAVGLVLAWPLARIFLVFYGRAFPELESTLGLQVSWYQPLITVILVVSICALTGVGTARRVYRKSEAVLLRQSANAFTRPSVVNTVMRALWALAFAGAAIACWVIEGKTSIMKIQLGICGAFSTFVLIIMTTTWTAPLIQRALSWLVPLPNVSFFVATRTCAQESSRSVATVLPFAFAIGLLGQMYATQQAGGQGVSADSIIAIFGPSLLSAWVGGVGVLAMGAGRRHTDNSLLMAAGARHHQVVLTNVFEGVLHSITALVLGGLATLAMRLFLVQQMGTWEDHYLRDLPWPVLGWLSAATLTVVVGAILVSTPPPSAIPSRKLE